jgi:hypothetical protein
MTFRPSRGRARNTRVRRSVLGALVGLALLCSAPAMAPGEMLFINPPSPTIDDQIVVYYPMRGCTGEWTRWSREGRTIEIVVLVAEECLSPFYSTLVLGRLPVGNYQIQLYYRVRGSRSRRFLRSELFSVLPAR